MRNAILFALALGTCAVAATDTPRLKNDKVLADEITLGPAESETVVAAQPNVIVFLADGAGERPSTSGPSVKFAMKRGDVLYRGSRDGALKATGAGGLHFIRIGFTGAASTEKWGTTGLSPNYKLLLENGYTRAYDIRIPAGTSEPQHTHHDRVVVCLSGAELRHEMPDGRREDSSLKTGDCLWRRGGTHVGHNLGKTDLWVIAIEPK